MEKKSCKPKNPDDFRFLGKPNSKSEFIKQSGELALVKYDANGRAILERHYSTYNREHIGHTNPHLNLPQNYPNGNIPEIKTLKRSIYMCKNNNYVSEYSFDDIDDFKNSLLHGGEFLFKWNKIECDVFHDYDSGEKAFLL